MFDVRSLAPLLRCLRPGRRRLSSAFTLVEVIVATGVVGVGVVAVMTAVAGLGSGSAYTADTVVASALAGAMMSEVDTRPYEASTPAPTGRAVQDLVAYYPFEDTAGASVSDQSRITPLVPLDVVTPALCTWIPGSNGMSIASGGSVKSSASTSRISSACISSGKVTAEVWIEPASITCTESPIIGFGADSTHMNFILAQNAGNLLFYIRTGVSDSRGRPPAATLTAPLKKLVTHVVATFDGTTATVYMNAASVGQSGLSAGNLNPWQSHPIQMAQLTGFGSPWAGKVFLAAVYSRALTGAEINANYAAGPSPSRLYNRTGYDDIDDYNGYADAPPRAEDGSAIAGAEQFSRTVEVRNVLPTDLSSVQSWGTTDAKRISVCIYKNYKLLAKLVRARYRGVSRDDTPDPGY